MNILLIPDGHRRWAKEHDTTNAEAYERACQRIVDIGQYMGERAISNQLWVAVLAPFNFIRESQEVTDIVAAGLRIHEIGAERDWPLNITANGRLDLLPEDYADRYRTQQAQEQEGAFTIHQMLGWMANTEVMGLARYAQANPDIKLSHEDLVAQSDIKERIDIVLRTGSSSRMSALAPWHSLDAELYFTQTQFPDYTLKDFGNMLDDYTARGPRSDPWQAAHM